MHLIPLTCIFGPNENVNWQLLKTDAMLDNFIRMCWFSEQNLFPSSSELFKFTEDTGRFLHSTDHCDDEDGTSDLPDVDISGPNILQIVFAMLTFLFMFFLTPSCDRCPVTDIISASGIPHT